MGPAPSDIWTDCPSGIAAYIDAQLEYCCVAVEEGGYQGGAGPMLLTMEIEDSFYT